MPATFHSDEPVDRRLCRLMVAAQDGDKTSYAALLAESVPLIRRVARRSGAPPDLVDDIVQETLITLHRARQTYDPARSFIAWLNVIAKRRAIDALRRSERTRNREIHAPADVERYADPAADATSAWRETSRADDLSAALGGLTPRQREAVDLIVVQGRSLADAATTSGRTKGALKVNFHRALASLKQRLRSGEGEDE